MSRLSDDLKRSPEVYAHSWDTTNDAVLLIALGEAEHAKASFLDQRLLGPNPRGQWIRRADVLAAVAEAGLAEHPAFIFHIGHVGSTLLSRLLGAAPSVLSVREPLPLRTLALLDADLATPESVVAPAVHAETLEGFLKLWSRSFRPGQRAVVKATSFASELAEAILDRASAPPALMLTARPEAYVASILGGPNSRIEARAMAQSRLRRLHRRLGEPSWRLWEMSEGEVIAMSWAAEACALVEAAAAHPAQAGLMDFDSFLREPLAGLAAAFSRFGTAAPTDQLEALIAGPLMRQYSKAPEHAYDARLRAEVLAAGRSENLDEFNKAMRWLESAANIHPVIRQACDNLSMN